MALRPAGRLASTSDELQRKYAEVAEQAYIDVMTGLETSGRSRSSATATSISSVAAASH